MAYKGPDEAYVVPPTTANAPVVFDLQTGDIPVDTLLPGIGLGIVLISLYLGKINLSVF